jgi:hypothetical protein
MDILILILIAAFLLIILQKGGKKTRRRRPPFKNRYDLNRRQSISEFERKLARAMFIEVNEVFVAAFCTDDEVLFITATVGTKYRCSSSDSVGRWGHKALAARATQIRQYHNHPHVFGRSFISTQDRRSNRVARPAVEQYGIRFRSFLIYKPWIGTYVLKEYN